MRRVLLTLLVIVILPAPAMSEQCIDYGDGLEWWVGAAPSSGYFRDSAISGRYAYSVVTYGSGFYLVERHFEVHDISDPRSPQFVTGVFLSEGNIYERVAVAVEGNCAYVVHDSDLEVIDISDPADPQLVGGVDTPGGAGDLTISGSYAYVADGHSGLQVIDISDPVSPQLVGGEDTPSFARGVDVSGDYAYVADGESGLQVIDITNPAGPLLIGSVDTPGRALHVAIVGHYAYVADDYSGLRIVDISDPANSQIVGWENTQEGVYVDLAVSGSYVFAVTSWHQGFTSLRVFDASDPANLRIVGRVDMPVGWAEGVDVSGDYAYVAGAQLVVVDISSPVSPQLVGGVDTPGRAWDVAVAGTFAYVANVESGLQVIDISVPESPALVGGVDTPDHAYGVAVAGNYAYVAAARSGLQVIDISVPAMPQLVGGVDTRFADDVDVSGNYAYVADAYGLQVIDISDPADPQLVGRANWPGRAADVAISGTYAYVAVGGSGLQVIDISVPESPALVGSVDTPGVAMGVAVVGNYAYLAAVESGLQVIDISVPESPALVGGRNTPGEALDVAVAGNHAYVADHTGDHSVFWGGLRVIDISVPEAPAHVGGVHTTGSRGVAVSGNYVYLANGDSGLEIAWLQCDDSEQEVTIDIKPGSDPNPINCKGNPGVIPVAVLTTDSFDALTIDHTTVRFGPGEAAEAHVRKVPTPNGNGALSVKSMSSVPKRHEEDVDHDGDLDLVFHFARTETGIVCGDTEAVLTGQTYDGQSIYGRDTIQTVPEGDVEPEPDAIVQISPNPFNPATSIQFMVGEPQHVTVRVYDLRGQLVAELADGAYPAGRHQLEWRGRDTSERMVSSGTYFFRVDLGGQVEVRKALLLK